MAEQFYADVPNRLVAFVVDVVIVSALIFIGAVVVAELVGPVVHIHPTAARRRIEINQGRAAVDAAMSIVVSAFYFAGSWMHSGATPGQRMLGLRVHAAGAGTARITAVRALTRWLVLVAPLSLAGLAGGASALLGVVAFVAVAAWYAVVVASTARDERSRGIPDRVSGTVVTKIGQPAPVT